MSRNSENSNLPFWIASAKSGPAFAPKISIAFVVAAAISGALAISSRVFLNSSFESFPAALQFEIAFFMPEKAISVFTPAFSHAEKIEIDSLVSNPSARIGAPYFVRFSASLSTDIPLACAAIASSSRTFPYSSDSIPASPIARETSCTAETASVPVMLANFIKSSVVFSSFSPV